MKVLVTGHDGYIGRVLVPMFQAAGHEVVGADSFLFQGCEFGTDTGDAPSFRVDVRDMEPEMFKGVDAVVHLAAISNDPLGDLNPECTYDINYKATARVAETAKEKTGTDG